MKCQLHGPLRDSLGLGSPGQGLEGPETPDLGKDWPTAQRFREDG